MTGQTLGERLLEHNSALQNTIIGLDKKLGEVVACNQAANAAIGEALLMLEQAHTAAHHGDLLGCLPYIAQAMEILASEDPGPSEASPEPSEAS